MKVNTEFEVKQFIAYLNKFPNLAITHKFFSDNIWSIRLNDKTMYEITLPLWDKIQSEVPRLNDNKQVVH